MTQTYHSNRLHLVRFFVPGEPKGKDRPRFYKGHAISKNGDKEQRIIDAYKQVEKPHPNYEGAVYVFIDVNYGRRQSYSNKKWLAMLQKKIYAKKKPDVDNIAKLVLDALNGVAYKDDKQVVYLIVKKQYEINEGLEIELLYCEGDPNEQET